MIVFLVAGIACLALFAFQLTRPRLAAQRDRRAALATVRSVLAKGRWTELAVVGTARAGTVRSTGLATGRSTALAMGSTALAAPREWSAKHHHRFRA